MASNGEVVDLSLTRSAENDTMSFMTSQIPMMYTIEEAAQLARTTAKALRQLRYRGRGPRVRKVEGRLLISDPDLASWLAGDDPSPSNAPQARSTTAEESVA